MSLVQTMFTDLSTTTILLGITVILAIVILVQTMWLFRIQKRLNIALSGKDGDRIDDTLREMQDTVAQLYSFSRKADTHLTNLEDRMQDTLRGVETIRFNPFRGDGSGGNNSFSVALVTERGDGIVVSSLYTRERTNVFAKRIQNLTPSHELSAEEEQAVTTAHGRTTRERSRT